MAVSSLAKRTISSSYLGAVAAGGSNDPYVLNLLHEEATREQLERETIERAKIEEDLLTLSGSPRDELQMATLEERQAAIKANKKFWKEQRRQMRKINNNKSGEKPMGFGNKASNSKQTKEINNEKTVQNMMTFNPKLDRDGFGAILQQEGVVRINKVVSDETIVSLRQYIDEELDRNVKDTASGKISEQARFARVLLKHNRWDMSLPFDEEENGADIVMQALWELLGDSESPERGTVGHVIESTLTSDAQLHELSSLISDPNSDRQIIHPDVAHQGEMQKRTGPFVTCFVSLQDVDREMGPTEFLPRTHTEEHHLRLNDYNLRDEMLRNAPSKLSLLSAGTSGKLEFLFLQK